ncbi:cupin domain-containing protein [Sulfurovum sp. ST-21]|uniref:Cupin domain-containing protein n=1 Tax=Sulfurovum indicum TaxID=2779528 RepID=A0A7M1S354_9BACT|nr:cupin domain-containing protein [Sulfurovum indicum]QOR61421.1 cupin domain-containing protein [Sulfurovum indicum]
MFELKKKYSRVKRGILLVIVPSVLMLASVLKATETAVAYTHNDSKLKWGPCPSFIPKGCEIAVLHGDPAKRNTDIFFKVPANFAIPHHWHTSAERMILLSGKLKVTYDNQDTELLEPGTYAYGPSRLSHTAFCEKGEPCVLFIAFEEPIDAFEVIKASQ